MLNAKKVNKKKKTIDEKAFDDDSDEGLINQPKDTNPKDV